MDGMVQNKFKLTARTRRKYMGWVQIIRTFGFGESRGGGTDKIPTLLFVFAGLKHFFSA
jgi:hypothetical protein